MVRTIDINELKTFKNNLSLEFEEDFIETHIGIKKESIPIIKGNLTFDYSEFVEIMAECSQEMIEYNENEIKISFSGNTSCEGIEIIINGSFAKKENEIILGWY